MDTITGQDIAEAQEWTEAKLQGWVRNTAIALGWLYYHTHRSKHSAAGYPDVSMVSPPSPYGIRRHIYAELKRSRKTKPSAQQTKWLNWLSGTGAEVYLWTPENLQVIADVLTKGPQERTRWTQSLSAT
jgi:hypothetical protein